MLRWPDGETFGPETTSLRRALILDERPGREYAQAEARRLLERHGPRHTGWWRFEGETSIDCFIATDQLVVTVEGKRTDVLSPRTSWYPGRTQLVRNLEAARERAIGRAWGTLLISEDLVPDGSFGAVAASLDDAAPHLTDLERAQLQAAYLGNITWREACEAIGADYAALPDKI